MPVFKRHSNATLDGFLAYFQKFTFWLWWEIFGKGIFLRYSNATLYGVWANCAVKVYFLAKLGCM